MNSKFRLIAALKSTSRIFRYCNSITGMTRDYDNWAKLAGDKSFKYRKILRIYTKLEKYRGLFPGAQHGNKGPIPIVTGTPPLLKNYKMAAKELGYKFGDSNGPQMEGISPSDFTKTRSGKAITTCSILVDPIIGIRKRLTVLTYAEATKIIFRQKIATGVEYLQFGKRFMATAKNEVILSGGVYGSPLLLFESGIGPAEMLSKAKIQTVHNLPVGKNLEDHAGFIIPISFGSPQKSVYYNLKKKNVNHLLKRKADGLLSELPNVAHGFFVSSAAKNDTELNWPDIQVLFLDGFVDSNGNIYNFVTVFLGRSKSSGSFKLNTKAYLEGKRKNDELALIDYPLFQTEDDVVRALEGKDIVLKILETKALRKLGVKLVPIDVCLKTSLMNSDEYWRCVIKNSAITTYHPTGTCRMGLGSADPDSVVDSKFRVNGVRNLRIIDASAFPINTNSNTNAPTLLFTAKGASVLKRKWGGVRHALFQIVELLTSTVKYVSKEANAADGRIGKGIETYISASIPTVVPILEEALAEVMVMTITHPKAQKLFEQLKALLKIAREALKPILARLPPTTIAKILAKLQDSQAEMNRLEKQISGLLKKESGAPKKIQARGNPTENQLGDVNVLEPNDKETQTEESEFSMQKRQMRKKFNLFPGFGKKRV